MASRKILITGAAGRIGKVIKAGLKDRYEIRILYNRTVLPPEPGEEVVRGNVSDLDKMVEAVEGVDAVVHLAGNPSTKATFEETVEANIRGTYSIYEAAHRAGVKRVILASTNHVTGFYEKKLGVYTTPEMPVRPDSYYGASKAYGEALGQYYSDAFGLSVICLRIGSFQPEKAVKERKSDRILSTWISHKDMVQLAWKCIEAPELVEFGIYYGISNNKRAYWDTQNAREDVGYDPQDDAEEYA